MTIILGVYEDSYFKLSSEHKAVRFGKSINGWICTDEEHVNNPFDCSITHEVCYNLDACESCVFDVTHLKLPFNSAVITLKELHVVMNNLNYFNKTEFFVNSKQINKIKLRELFLANEPIEFKDYAELFIVD